MSIADLLLDALRFLENHWPSLAGIALAFALRKRIPALRPRRGQGAGSGAQVVSSRRQSSAPCALRSAPFALALVIGVSLAMSIGWAAIHGMPLPQFHDDYGYLLIADTFAHGRLANPPHPMADAFETMHVLQRPTYAAKFPPGEGVVLMAGIAGSWLACAAACAAIWWALRAWLTPELALLGGLLTAIHPTMLDWAESYHGGALAAIAGAVVMGVMGRVAPLTRPSATLSPRAGRGAAVVAPLTRPLATLSPQAGRGASVVAGLAIAVFAYSRPFEGLVFTIAVFIAFRPWRAIPIAILGLVPLAVYNHAVTGSAFTLPYTIYEQRYDPVPNFLWESPRRVAPEPNLEMATVYRVAYAGHWHRVHEPGGMRDEIVKKLDGIGRTVFGSLLLILFVPLVMLPRVVKKQKRLALILLLFSFAPFSIIWWIQMHYLAPATAVVVALMVLMIAELPPSFAAAVLIAFVVNAAIDFAKPKQAGYEAQRRAIAAEIGDGVVLVDPTLFDVVYNGADIDHQRVIWARDLGPARNAALRAYYKNRRFWYLPSNGSRGPGRPRPLP